MAEIYRAWVQPVLLDARLGKALVGYAYSREEQLAARLEVPWDGKTSPIVRLQQPPDHPLWRYRYIQVVFETATTPANLAIGAACMEMLPHA